jgi:glutathione peroxidase-family protein
VIFAVKVLLEKIPVNSEWGKNNIYVFFLTANSKCTFEERYALMKELLKKYPHVNFRMLKNSIEQFDNT